MQLAPQPPEPAAGGPRLFPQLDDPLIELGRGTRVARLLGPAQGDGVMPVLLQPATSRSRASDRDSSDASMSRTNESVLIFAPNRSSADSLQRTSPAWGTPARAAETSTRLEAKWA
jgi:hypothetical protein